VWTLLLADGSTVYRADAVEGGSVVAWRDHSAPVHTVVTAELDGVPVALTASGDDTVRLWDLRSGRGLGVVLDGHGGAAYAVAAATVDGRALVFGAGRSGLVRAVDVTDLLRPDVPRDPAASGPAPGPAADPASGPADAGWAGAEPTPVLTATGPVRSLAVAHSGATGWLVVADGAALRWHPVTDDLEPGWTSGLTGPVTGLVALPGLVVAATGDGLVAYRPTAATGAGRHAGAGRA
jgi:WD40 repeat protein